VPAQGANGGPIEVVVALVQVRLDLELRRRAANPAAADRPARVEGLARPQVAPAAGLRLPAVAALVELERVEVELAPGRIAKHEGRRPLVLIDVPKLGEDRGQPLDVLGADREIEVVVGPRLEGQESVDAPPAIDPPLDAGSVEAV